MLHTMDDLSTVPSFSTGANFLDANSQAHHKPLSAFGDLADNARESGAHLLVIDAQWESKMLIITMTDNGIGMSEKRMRTGIGGIAHSSKEHNDEVHYGMGAKSALPRLSPSSLVFTKNGKMQTVALISTTLSRKLGSAELKIPIASWDQRSGELLRDVSDEAPLTHEQRMNSLALLMKHTPYKSENALLGQFDAIPGRTGTRLVLFECNLEQYDVSKPHDIRVPGDDKVRTHEVSLREYLTVLYYCDATTNPALKMDLCGKRVQPRNWTTFLCEWPKHRLAYEYNPACLRDEAAEAGKVEMVSFAKEGNVVLDRLCFK